jgi:hypothetical protein
MHMNHAYIVLNIIGEDLMKEICGQFPTALLQYACVSIDYSQWTATFRTMYIQIILKKVVNKTGWFLDKVTGTYERQNIGSY